jgi:S1-C subfamily serine protease
MVVRCTGARLARADGESAAGRVCDPMWGVRARPCGGYHTEAAMVGVVEAMTKRLMLTTLLLLTAMPVRATDWVPVVKDLAKKAPRIEILAGTEKGVCTGIWLNTDAGYVLTAAHCVVVPPNTRLDITVAGRDAAVVRANRLLDIAVLRVEPQIGDVAMALAEKTPPLGTEVGVVGYSFGYKQATIAVGRIALVLDDDKQQMRVDIMAVPGQSGGGLIDDQGRLVGMTSSIQYMGPAHLGSFVRVEDIRSYVAQYLPAEKP